MEKITFEKQTKLVDEEKGIKGNCMAACFANVLGYKVDQVPAFEELFDCEKPKGFWWDVVKLWWKTQGYNYISGSKFTIPKDQYYFVCGKSPRDKNIWHMVIYKNGAMVFDPHPDGTGLSPGTEAYFEWLEKLT